MLVYRYLYNTFGETISVRTPLLLLCTQHAMLVLLRLADTQACACTVDDTRLASSSPHRATSDVAYPPARTPQTIGASFAMKKVETGRQCNLGIWDTAGQERCDSLSATAAALLAIICYDLTDRQSFECLQQWIRKVTDEARPAATASSAPSSTSSRRARRAARCARRNGGAGAGTERLPGVGQAGRGRRRGLRHRLAAPRARTGGGGGGGAAASPSTSNGKVGCC